VVVSKEWVFCVTVDEDGMKKSNEVVEARRKMCCRGWVARYGVERL